MFYKNLRYLHYPILRIPYLFKSKKLILKNYIFGQVESFSNFFSIASAIYNYRSSKLVNQFCKSNEPKKISGEIIFGVSPVLSALEARRRNIYRLLVVKSNKIKSKKVIAAVEIAKSLAKANGVQVLSVSRHDLNVYTENRPHQGLSLDCSPLNFEAIIDPPINKPKRSKSRKNYAIWLALDEVYYFMKR